MLTTGGADIFGLTDVQRCASRGQEMAYGVTGLGNDLRFERDARRCESQGQ